jgi:hypothetical protein
MPYLFDSEVDAVFAKKSDDPDIRNTKTRCEDETTRLQQGHGPVANYQYPDDAASQLVANMGTKSARGRDAALAGSPHASDEGYLGSGWQLASGNQPELVAMVHQQLQNAYNLQIDIRSSEVIGTMYKLAGLVFSTIRPYASIVRQKEELR